MRYAHIIHYFNSAPWALLPEKLYAILELIELRAQGLTLSDSEIEARIGPQGANGQTSVAAPATSVAVLPIWGTIANRAGLLRRISGGMSVETFRHDFRAALRNPDVSAIVLDIDSPGGSTSGIEEISTEIHSARSQKRIIAAVDSLAASAAYWIASSAHEIAVTPSGHVGSIGVLGVHMDVSKKAEAEGVRVSVVSAGKYKAEGHEFAPLSEEARGHLQALVDDRYDAFVRAVAHGRNVTLKSVREGFGEGRLVTAKEALALGMVDSIETTDQVISRAASRAMRARKIGEAASRAAEIVAMGGAQLLAAYDDCPEGEDCPREESMSECPRGDDCPMGSKARARTTVDPLSAYIAERLSAGVVPKDVSSEIAPEGTTWAAPALRDFTSKTWGELTDAEKNRIAMHAAWASEMPPVAFGSIKLFHHRPSDGAAVPNGVRNALARLNQTEGLGSDRPRVEAHLRAHMDKIQERRAQALTDPKLDPKKRMVEVLKLG